MRTISTIGIDLAKNVIHLHAVDRQHKVIAKKKLTRRKTMEWLSQLSPCLIGIEACGGSHYWHRTLTAMGHQVKLISPQFVKPYVKSNKNDANDAAAICEAVTRPHMRFVPSKSVEQQDIQSIHRVRFRLVGQRTALVNQIRGLLYEYGITIPQGISSARKKLPILLDPETKSITSYFKILLTDLYDEFIDLDSRIAKLDHYITDVFSQSEACQKIGKLPGIGPLTATALVANIGDPGVFKNGRQMAAWLGLVPRQFSTGGKPKLGGISKRGDTYLRTLLVHGGRSVVRTSSGKSDQLSKWAQDLKARKGPQVAAVAVANKNARMIWAMLSTQAEYQAA
ncbi:MAG: IS110 family transposase [Candidatus Thiodiazotropha endolucinida]